MTEQKTITMKNIAANLTTHPTFMAIELKGNRYPKAQPKTNALGKVLMYSSFVSGTLTIGTSMTFADEKQAIFAEVPIAELTRVEVGIYHSLAGIKGMLPFEAQLTVNVVLTTPTATYDLLNTDLQLVPAILAWVKANNISLSDPLKLQQRVDVDWSKVTLQAVEDWAADTRYAAPYGMLSATAPMQ